MKEWMIELLSPAAVLVDVILCSCGGGWNKRNYCASFGGVNQAGNPIKIIIIQESQTKRISLAVTNQEQQQ